MAFGPRSKNPRERRAYAHAAIARARLSRTDEDFAAAELAVLATGGRKAEGSGFRGALATAALADIATRAIVVPANALLAPDRRKHLYAYGDQHQSTSCIFGDFTSRNGRNNIYFGRMQTCTPEGEIISASPLTVEGIAPPYNIIPTQEAGDQGVDVIAVRRIDPFLRAKLAHLVTLMAPCGDLPIVSIEELYSAPRQ